MLMYQLRETMCLIYSARQVRRHYFTQMSNLTIKKWWKSWDKYHVKLRKIRVNLPESAISVKTKYWGEDAAHNEANLKLYKISGAVVDWYKKDQETREDQDDFMKNCCSNRLYYSREHVSEILNLEDELDDIFENGLDDVVGEALHANKND